MKKIKLTQGKYALVSDEDYEFLSQWNWCAFKGCTTFYACRHPSKINRKQTTIYMHQVIAERMSIKSPDHIDTDGLNNLRSNLRQATQSQQHANQNLQKNNKSGYKGVSWHKRCKKWKVYINANKNYIFLGYFIDIKEAARAYNKAAIKYYGTFARINDVEHKGKTLSAALLTPEELLKYI
jgi:hypothetical protein